jgi:endoglucanase
MNLDKGSSVGLPPNWITINRTTGAIAASTNGLDTNYGYDAIRTPWRLALDYEWNKDPRAKATLQKMSFLQKQWENNGKIDSVYGHDGSVVSSDEALESYGTSLGYFSVINTTDGDQVYDQKIKTLYNQDKNEWSNNLTYYSDNWVWFGIGLYKHQLPNLIDNTK